MERQQATWRALETALIEKCWTDPEFKREVVKDPKGMLERHIGQKLPPNLKIFIHEEDAKTLHFSLPPAPSNATELSDDELEKVAGGTEIVMSVVGTVSLTMALSIGITAAEGKKGGW